MKQKCNRKNQGFTLVELIVVLVIIAIMAAIVSPSILGYIDQTKNKQYITNAGIAVTTAQTMLSDTYHAGKLTLTKAQKEKWKERMGFSDNIKLTVETFKSKDDEVIRGNERAFYTITRAIYVEDGVSVYYNGTEYQVLTDDSDTKLSHPITILNYDQELEDSDLMRR